MRRSFLHCNPNESTTTAMLSSSAATPQHTLHLSGHLDERNHRGLSPVDAGESPSSYSTSNLRSRSSTERETGPMIAPPSPCGTPPRKSWEVALQSIRKKKDPLRANSPTLSSSPSSSITSTPIPEDLSTGTVASSASVGGGSKKSKKKSSFSLIPGSTRLVSRNAMNKTSVLTSIFSKGGGTARGRFGRGHKSMDALDVPLRKGIERTRSNSGSTGNPVEGSPVRDSGPQTVSITQTNDASQSTSVPDYYMHARCDERSEQEKRIEIAKGVLSGFSRATARVSNLQLNDRSHHSANYDLDRSPSSDWHINPIVNEGVELPLTTSSTSSAPSLTQLHRRRSNSRTRVYGANSNSSTPVRQYQQSHHDELDMRMVPQIPSLRKASCGDSYHNDVGLNLDDSDSSFIDANQYNYDHSRSSLLLGSSHSNNNNSNTATIVTGLGVPEPPESLDEILGGISGSTVSIHSSSSSQYLSHMGYQVSASPETKKAFTKIHNSSEYGRDSISPFLGGRNASNYDLAGAHRSCITTQHSMLLRSNNSNLNSTGRSPFAPGFSAMHQSIETESNSPSSLLSKSLPLDTGLMQKPKDSRLLKPIQSAETWAQGRRYLIAPAAMAACPLTTIKNLTGSSTQTATKAAEAENSLKCWGSIELGETSMTYVGDKYHLTFGKWSSCRLLLRQNYLFEYDVSSPSDSLPRGIAHLDHAVARPHKDFDDALELHFYASPCAKADHRVLLIRVARPNERDAWITCLNRAAKLRVDDLWDYNEDRPLGNGRYASIYPARRKVAKTEEKNDTDGSNCALKVIDKTEFWKLVVKGRERCDTIVRELAVQSTLTARFGTKPTILQIKGFFETSDKVVIEVELLDGKDLFEYISCKSVLDENEAGLIIRDILLALHEMNEAGICHRDIKPANILMVRCDDSKYGTSVKLGDFGMSTLVGVDGLVRGRCGSPGYVAPEILKAEAGGGYGNHVDMFSAGVTLYVMLCGYEPFYGETEKELIRANKKARLDFPDSEWKKISPEAKDLVSQMLKEDSNKRIGTREALVHPWIVRIQKEKDKNYLRNIDLTEAESVCSIM